MLASFVLLSVLSFLALGESKKECEKVLISTAVAQAPGAGFCNTWTVNNVAALEIADANPDASGFVNAYVNRPITVNGQTISLNPAVYAAWPTNLPAVGSVGPFSKNIGERNTVFTDICFWRSPDRTRAQCNPTIQSTCVKVINYPPPPSRPPYAWVQIAKGGCPFSYPDLAVQSISQLPAPGNIMGFISVRCAALRYAAGSSYVLLTDEWKNTYIMHATTTPVMIDDINLDAIVLPDKWRVERLVADQEIIIWPLTWGTDTCFHTVLRDHLGNGYHQYTYGETVGNPNNNANGRDMHLISMITKNQQCVTAMQGLGMLQDQCPGDGSNEGGSSEDAATRRLRGF